MMTMPGSTLLMTACSPVEAPAEDEDGVGVGTVAGAEDGAWDDGTAGELDAAAGLLVVGW
jgi:hypothetical protein